MGDKKLVVMRKQHRISQYSKSMYKEHRNDLVTKHGAVESCDLQHVRLMSVALNVVGPFAGYARQWNRIH